MPLLLPPGPPKVQAGGQAAAGLIGKQLLPQAARHSVLGGIQGGVDEREPQVCEGMPLQRPPGSSEGQIDGAGSCRVDGQAH